MKPHIEEKRETAYKEFYSLYTDSVPFPFYKPDHFSADQKCKSEGSHLGFKRF